MPKVTVRPAESEPEAATANPGSAAYDKLDFLCSEYNLAVPGWYTTPSMKEEDLSAIKMHRGAFDFSEKIVDRLVCRLRIFDMIRTLESTDLRSFSEGEWQNLITQVSTLRAVLLTNSAVTTHVPIFCGFHSSAKCVRDTEISFRDIESVPRENVKEFFVGPFIDMIAECKIQRVLSTIRNKLLTLDDVSPHGLAMSTLPIVLPAKQLQAFLESSDQYRETDPNLLKFFHSLLKAEGQTVVGLIPPTHLKKKLASHHLKTLSSSLMLMLQHWSISLGNSSCTVERELTVDEVVVDAFAVGEEQPESVVVDAKEADLPILTTPPPNVRGRRKASTSPSQPASAGGAESSKETKKRMRFTEEEKRAIAQGSEKHGKGNWATIKREYSSILANRSSVQIKDCYRTMVKLGEIKEEKKSATDTDESGEHSEKKGDDEGEDVEMLIGATQLDDINFYSNQTQV